MHRILVASAALLALTPASAQIEFSGEPGETTCGEFTAMGPDARHEALIATEPAGGELIGSAPDIARQWSDEVASACAGHPDRPLSQAAAQALGGN